MESIDQDRWARLLDAARRANGGAGTAPERGAVRLKAERSAAGSAVTGRRGWWSLGARIVGGLAVLAVGAVHLQQYEMLYSATRFFPGASARRW